MPLTRALGFMGIPTFNIMPALSITICSEFTMYQVLRRALPKDLIYYLITV